MGAAQPEVLKYNSKNFQSAFSVSRETLERLKTYEKQLQLWQKTINLVAPSTLEQVWHRHFADSAQLLALAPANPKVWIDLGSGAGFPGLVVAILLAGQGAKTKVTLIESDTRKAAFLREVARAVAVPVDILSLRIEAAATRANVGSACVVSARALAPLNKLLGLAVSFCDVGTVCLLLKGRETAAELQDAEKEWFYDLQRLPSLTDSEASVLRMTRLRGQNNT
jgi:16S rRNA (guanine527-N7)-methyltransferase